MIFVPVDFHALGDFFDFSVNTYVEVSLAAHTFKEFPIVAFTLAYQRGQYIDVFSCIILLDHLDDFFFCILHHFLSGSIAICCAGTCVEQTEIIIDFRCCAYSGTWILIGGFLFYADDRTQTGNFIYVRSLHIAQKVSGISRKSLYITSLTFGKNSVESQRGLA